MHAVECAPVHDETWTMCFPQHTSFSRLEIHWHAYNTRPTRSISDYLISTMWGGSMR